MFYPYKITSIKKTDRVLEIGPGAMPHPRADVFLEKKFDSEKDFFVQSGYHEPVKDKRKWVYYDGGKFPFKDKEFDYIICSHVIEHISLEGLALFVDEMQRVAGKGYIEFPTVFYELINYQDVHVWFMNFRDGYMHFLSKNLFQSNDIHKIYREMFYGSDNYTKKMFLRYKDLFFSGVEWDSEIKYKLVDKFEDLVNKDDLGKFKKYFSYYSKIDMYKYILFMAYYSLKRKINKIFN